MPNRFDKWIGRMLDSMKMLFEHRAKEKKKKNRSVETFKNMKSALSTIHR